MLEDLAKNQIHGFIVGIVIEMDFMQKAQFSIQGV